MIEVIEPREPETTDERINIEIATMDAGTGCRRLMKYLPLCREMNLTMTETMDKVEVPTENNWVRLRELDGYREAFNNIAVY